MPGANAETKLLLERIEHAMLYEAFEQLAVALAGKGGQNVRALHDLVARAVVRANISPLAHADDIEMGAVDLELVKQNGGDLALTRLRQRMNKALRLVG